jgi:hypothetical protein
MHKERRKPQVPGGIKPKNIYRYLFFVVLLFSLQSCASFREGLYNRLIDRNNGNFFLENENNVRLYLEKVVNSHEYFSVKAYTRNIFSFQSKKTRLLFHSFYVITGFNGVYYTISFYGSEMYFSSRGVWVMNSDSDLSAYRSFIGGKNGWDVTEIETQNGIDTEKTVRNIITMMDNNIQYYYINHLSYKPDMHNCNTALDETLVKR